MKIRICIFVVSICAFIIHVDRVPCNDDYKLPIEECTENKSLDEFLSEFALNKVNEIVLKDIISIDKMVTIKTFKDDDEIKRILSEVKNIKCIKSTLAMTHYELWFYENEILHLKLALHIHPKMAVVRVFRPEHSQAYDDPLNRHDLAFLDEKYCSWLNSFTDAYERKYWEKIMNGSPIK